MTEYWARDRDNRLRLHVTKQANTMNEKHRAVLRRLRELMGNVDQDGWFITPELPNSVVYTMLVQCEREIEMLEAESQAFARRMITAAEDVEIETFFESLEDDLAVALPGDKCAVCQHPARNHARAICRAHHCGCGRFIAIQP